VASFSIIPVRKAITSSWPNHGLEKKQCSNTPTKISLSNEHQSALVYPVLEMKSQGRRCHSKSGCFKEHAQAFIDFYHERKPKKPEERVVVPPGCPEGTYRG